ncbi:MAG: FlgT C-terminal domain-containing protein [Acidobacteriota bacterium]
MKKGRPGISLALAIPLIVLATSSRPAAASTRPPRDLSLRQGHWTAWEAPAIPDGAQVHIIVKGDTLWDLAAENLGDPFLWPQIWDLNRYVLDSHWIYPGDPLVMPGPLTVVADETMPEKVEPAADSDAEDQADAVGVPPEVALLPPEDASGRPAAGKWKKIDPDSAANHAEMLCAGYILPARWESDVFIYAGEEEQKLAYGTGDVVYINRGLSSGVKPGDSFFVVHEESEVTHPVSGHHLGYLVRRMAQVQVMAVQEETSTVEIVDGCDTVHLGFGLVEYSDLTSPKIKETGLERYGVEDNGAPKGRVIFTKDRRRAVGEGDIVYIDLGREDGVEVGDYLMIYRDGATDQRPNEAGFIRRRYNHRSSIPVFNTRKLPRGKTIPRRMLGQMVILASAEHTSTVKIMSSWREIYRGDEVQILN